MAQQQTEEKELLFNKDIVFDAMCAAIPNIDGMKVIKQDKAGGFIKVEADTSLWSWGENISISLSSLSDSKTKVRVVSSSQLGRWLGGGFEMGKNKKNIGKIFFMTLLVLPTLNYKEQNVSSVADEIIKLKKLLDEGILSSDEFNELKNKLLKD
jgi:hypothetical protein